MRNAAICRNGATETCESRNLRLVLAYGFPVFGFPPGTVAVPYMNTQNLKKLCASFPGAIETLSPAPSNVLVYAVGGKSFAYFKTSDPEKWRFSVRVLPERFLELTDTPGIKPARYMGRFHWVTIVKVESMPEDYLTELVQWSYRKAFGSLSRKKQAELGIARTPAQSCSK